MVSVPTILHHYIISKYNRELQLTGGGAGMDGYYIISKYNRELQLATSQ